MPWLSRVEISKHYKAPDFAVDLTPDPGTEFKHLVLTGPNGSGKTTILNRLAQLVERSMQRQPEPTGPFDVMASWTSEQDLKPEWLSKRFISAKLSMQRVLVVDGVDGPTKMQHDRRATPSQELSKNFLAYLVNLQVQARLAREDDPAASDAIFSWFRDLEASLGELFDVPGLRIEFLRETYDIRFVEPSGLGYGFHQLPSGYASVLRILAELVLRIDALGIRHSPDLSGVVMIDEIDAFLHPALQERVLPFLIRAYPRLQFVVATHSPAVATSVENAMVVALGSGYSFRAESLVGTPYGQLLTSLFGIETDVDLASTERLHELQRLWELPHRTSEDQVRLRALALDLQKTSNPLALEVWLQLQLQAAS